MNSAKPRLTAVPVVADTAPISEASVVGRAKAEVAAILAEYDRLAESTRIVESQPHEKVAGQAQSQAQGLRQRMRAAFTRKGAGAPADPNEPDMAALSDQLVEVERAERRAALIAEAKQSALNDLAAQGTALHPKLAAAKQALVVAQFDAAGVDIREQLLPAFMAAAEQLRLAYGKLVGAGRAHNAMAQVLRERHDTTRQPLGVERPVTQIYLNVVGFGLDVNGYNRVVIDAGAASDAACVELLARWSGN